MSESKGIGRDGRIDRFRRAAIPVFAAKGFRRTSMADVARAAGVSRPLLYKYFTNRVDLFRAAFDAVLNDAADAALAALHADGTVAERLDGYLQRANGDAYEAMSKTAFGDELMEDRHEFAADVATDALDRSHEGLRSFLETTASADDRSLSTIIDLLTMSPIGLKGDKPSPSVYRERLTALAAAAAALVE